MVSWPGASLPALLQAPGLGVSCAHQDRSAGDPWPQPLLEQRQESCDGCGPGADSHPCPWRPAAAAWTLQTQVPAAGSLSRAVAGGPLSAPSSSHWGLAWDLAVSPDSCGMSGEHWGQGLVSAGHTGEVCLHKLLPGVGDTPEQSGRPGQAQTRAFLSSRHECAAASLLPQPERRPAWLWLWHG